MPKHAQLTVNQLRGPMNQLLTNLQGANGQEWLTAFNLFLRREPTWVRVTEGNEAPQGSLDGPELPEAFTNVFSDETNVFVCLIWTDKSLEEVSIFIELREFGGRWEDVVRVHFRQSVSRAALSTAITSDHCWKKVRELVEDDGRDFESAQLEGALDALLKDWYAIQANVGEGQTIFTLSPKKRGFGAITATVDTVAVEKFLRSTAQE